MALGLSGLGAGGHGRGGTDDLGRSRRLTGDRWLLAGDAAGFIDPVWSSGVYIAILSGEKAADALNRVLRQPELKAREFTRYARRVNRVMDLYLKFVTAWYTTAFAEVFFHPREFLRLVPAVNSILAGDDRQLICRPPVLR